MKKILLVAILALLTLCLFPQQSRLAETLRNHVTILASDSLSGRGFAFPEKGLAIDYITTQYRQAGFTAPYDGSYIHNFHHRLTYALIEGKNIIGIIEGSDPQLRNEFILLGAHLDHMGWKTINGEKVVWNGADDNASGVATIIEVGKMLAANRESLGRSIIIAAFDGEEAGLIGSTAFARTEINNRFNVAMMFSLDMVGMLEKNKGLNHAGFRSLKEGERIIAETLEQHNLNVREEKNKIESRTDTWPFAGKGIPAVYISTGLVSPYHKPEDDAHLLDFEGMASVAEMIADLTTTLSVVENLEADSRYISRKVDPKLMIGLLAGYGSSFHHHKTEFFDARPLLAIEYGLQSQVKVTDHFRLQPAITYQLAGSRTEAGKLRTHSVVPQLDLLITTHVSSIAQPTLFFIAGGYYDYIFAGREAGAPADFTAKYSDTGYGLRLGGGMVLMKTQMSFVYRYGLNRVNLNDADGEIFTRGFFFSSTMYF
jgi:hypothetical protein